MEMSDTLYINILRYRKIVGPFIKVRYLLDSELNEKKIAKVLSLIDKGKLEHVVALNAEDRVSISVVIERQKFWIGILDSGILDGHRVSYLYDNQTGNEEDVAVAGLLYPGWSICNDAELVKQILTEFIHSGTRLDSVTWREDVI